MSGKWSGSHYSVCLDSDIGPSSNTNQTLYQGEVTLTGRVITLLLCKIYKNNRAHNVANTVM